jgi:hypothetical protein
MVSIQKAMDSATFSHFVLALSHLFFVCLAKGNQGLEGIH